MEKSSMNLKNIISFILIWIVLMMANGEKCSSRELKAQDVEKEVRYRYSEDKLPIVDVILECEIPSLFNFTGAPLIVEKEEYDHKKMAEKFFGTLLDVEVEYSTDSFYGKKVITGISYKSKKENKSFRYGYDNGAFDYRIDDHTFSKPLSFSKDEAQKMVEEFINEYGGGIPPDAELLIEKIGGGGTITGSSFVKDITVHGLKFYYTHKSGAVIILDDPKYGGDYIEVYVNYKGVVTFHRHWRKIVGFKEEWTQGIISPTEALLEAVDKSNRFISALKGYKIINIDLIYHYHCWPPSEKKLQVLTPYWRFKCESIHTPIEYYYIYINAYTKDYIMCPWEKPFPIEFKYRLKNVAIEE